MPKKIAFALLLSVMSTRALADWSYDVDTDKMTGKRNETASVRSKGSVDLPFPYQGENPATLTVRQHPQYGLGVIVSVRKGQILCHSYSACNVKVRFDDAPPVTFSAVGPADNSSNMIFINNEQRFISSAKKAKSILIQVTFFTAGDHIMEFVSKEPLMWPVKR